MPSHGNPKRSYLTAVFVVALLAAFSATAADSAPAASPSILAAAEAGVLPTTADWMIEGNETSAGLGSALATAGDVNGDGFSDVIVAVPGRHVNGVRLGEVCVYLGSAAGPSGTPSWTVIGDQADASFASSVSTAGDVNGDGYDDVLVGAMMYSNGEANEGRVYLYLGSASGLATTPAWIGEPNEVRRSFGLCVAPAGDVNGDGFDDVIIGGPAYFMSFSGRAYVYLGSPSGLSSTPAWTASGEMTPDFFGWSCGTAGDLNGDGYADVVVGAALFSIDYGKQGKVYVYLGGPQGPSPTPNWTRVGETDEWLGISVSTAGDVNGDGYSDLLIGALAMGSVIPDEGRAYVHYGSPSGPEQDPAWMAAGGEPSAEFGFFVSTAGDITGDGHADVIVGARMYSGGFPTEGRACVFVGSAAGLSSAPDWTVDGGQASAIYGACVATAGDVDGDGYCDVLVGAPGYHHPETGEGAAYLYLGSAAGPKNAPSWTVEGNQEGAEYGSVVAAAGDVNGDGYGDALISAPLRDNGEVDEGWTGLYLGSSSGLAPAPAWIRESNQAGARSGTATAAAGDVNGDGYGDVVVGVPLFDAGQVDEGRAYLFSGNPSGLGTFPTWRTESDQDSAAFGSSVAGAGDVNGDGYADVLVGAPGFDGDQVNEGRAYLFHGSAGGLGLDPAWQADGNQTNAFFAASLASAGDVNGDGFSDVLIGDPLFDQLQGDVGRVSLYLGSSSGLGASPAWTVEGDQWYAQYGFAVASAGDVNGDGFSDVLVGTPFYDSGMIDRGRVDLFLGSASGLSATPAWTHWGDVWACGFGSSVASAGDVDGDGFSDVLIGAAWWGSDPDAAGRAFLYLGSPTGLGDSPVWTTTGDQLYMMLGNSVACAGDVEGDGFSDLLVGAWWYDGAQTDEGAAFLFSGNGSGGRPRIPRQLRVDGTAPIALLGSSDNFSSFRIGLLGRTAAGRGRVQLQWEVKPLGSPLDGTGLVMNPAGPSIDTGAPVPGVGSACPLNGLACNLPANTPVHGRLRVLARSPYFPRSPWFSMQGNGVQETDLRTPPADPLQVQSPPEADRQPSRLRSIQPNPFASRTSLVYDLERREWVRLAVFDAQGRRCALLVDGIQTAGRHVLPWDARTPCGERLPSGIYLARLEAGGRVHTARLVLLPGTGRPAYR